MPSKPRLICADKDDLVWERLDERIDLWLTTVKTSDIYHAAARFILQHRPGEGDLMHTVLKGGYNIAFRLQYKDGTSVIMRIPIKDAVPYPDEKVRYEVATMRYIKANTTIPVPYIYHYGMAADNPLGLGPFIIMEYVDYHQNLSRALMDPTRPPGKRPILDPYVDENRLEHIYDQVADILVQLDLLKFPRIGSLLQDESTGQIDVKGRPLLANMIDVVVHTSMPEEAIMPALDSTYGTGDAWFSALADIHMAQLVFQKRDVVDDADDARDKYVARQLFRRAVAEGRFSDDNSNEFTLYSEDLRPANILLDKDDKIVGVIDWEFAYAAPRSFSTCPPWWLLIEEPEGWPLGGMKGWLEMYEPRLQTFLRSLERVEAQRSPVGGGNPLSQPLSQCMRASWARKSWMRHYAARRSWAFDYIWWKHLDEMLWGPNEDQDHKARISLLTQQQQDILEPFVAGKLEESKTKDITTMDSDRAAMVLKRYLI
ncbi:hypothetical protein Sste5346_008289 [Sporothrix stenoceras]|uniref:Aminoglycoside phosphotransferase domain-containing protein n=1 Tax=Sporothrix stenoceras TaxID=5173 RepID=A0ABR3YRI1_9PEZI